MLIPYISVKEPHTFEKEIKKSLFIAQLIPVHTEKEAEEALAGIRKPIKTRPITAGPCGREQNGFMKNRETTENRRERQDIRCSGYCR